MVCEHLQQLEQELLQYGIKETYRGQAWSHNCREWVYFHCVLNLKALRQRLEFEAGFVCAQCHDAIMGVLSKPHGFIPIST